MYAAFANGAFLAVVTPVADHYVCGHRPTEAQCQEAWSLYEQMKFCAAMGGGEDLVERYRVWLDRELLLSYIED